MLKKRKKSEKKESSKKFEIQNGSIFVVFAQYIL